MAALSSAGFIEPGETSARGGKSRPALGINEAFRNPFANRQVVSPAALVMHVQSDDAALGRYMLHYAETRGQVIERLGSLRPSRLQSDGLYTVYCAKGQDIHPSVLSLKKGTAVFVDDTGRPVLMALCGNPIEDGAALSLVEPVPERALGLTDSIGGVLGALGSAGVLSTVATGDGGALQPVPEPASILAFSAGALGLAAKRRKLRRQGR